MRSKDNDQGSGTRDIYQRWAKYSKYSYSSTIVPVLVLVLGRSVLVLVLVFGRSVLVLVLGRSVLVLVLVLVLENKKINT